MSDGGKPTLFGLDADGARRAVTLEPARVLCGDMRELLAAMPPESVHAVVTDPPYGLSSGDGATRGFMGKEWDARVPGPEFWAACLRVAKPGAHLLAFGGTRTAHRLACAIEDAGWEVRDCVMWLYGSGFPKSHNLEGEWKGWGTATKPAWEPVYLARKPFTGSVAQCVCEHGCGALNIDGCRIGTSESLNGGRYCPNKIGDDGSAYGSGINLRSANEYSQPLGRWPANLVLDEWHDQVLRLRCDIDSEVARVIRLYFGGVSDVREDHPNVSEPHATQEVLLEGVLPQAPRDAHGVEIQTLRSAAHDAGEGQDPSESAEACRASMCELEGRALQEPGLLDDRPVDAQRSRASAVQEHGQSQRPSCDPRASARDGTVAWPSSDAVGDCSPLQWGEGRQPSREPRDARQRDAQARPPGDPPRATSVASRERALEARASEIPHGWLTYFEPTGRSVRCGSAALLDAQTGGLKSGDLLAGHKQGASAMSGGGTILRAYGGGASRFFYTAKASRSEREAGLERFESRNVNDGRDTSIDNPYQRGDTQRRNVHPTVKPISLMRWLVRLITPPGGVVLDPFTGSGSTGVAAVLEGARFIGCELSAEYAQLARARIAHAADEDDGDQLTLFERSELKPVVKVQPAQASFGWLDDDEVTP